MSALFSLGIDLGTSNCAVAVGDSPAVALLGARPRLRRGDQPPSVGEVELRSRLARAGHIARGVSDRRAQLFQRLPRSLRLPPKAVGAISQMPESAWQGHRMTTLSVNGLLRAAGLAGPAGAKSPSEFYVLQGGTIDVKQHVRECWILAPLIPDYARHLWWPFSSALILLGPVNLAEIVV